MPRPSRAALLFLTAGVSFFAPLPAEESGCVPGPAWPEPGGEVPLNPVFVLATCGEPIERIRPFLRDEAGEAVQLETVDRIADGFAAVAPALPLQPLRRYELRWRRRADEKSPLPRYRTADDTDFDPPQWRAEPALDVAQSSVAETPRATFALPIANPGEPLIAQVTFHPELDPEAPATTVLALKLQREPERPGALIADGRSAGNALLAFDSDYRATIKLIDRAGNRSDAGNVRFRTPEAPPPRKCASVTSLSEPWVRRKTDPGCTEVAEKARFTGTVEGTLTVRADGTVSAVEVDRGLPFGLDEAARAALRDWLLEPAKAAHRPVSFKTTFYFATDVYEPVWKKLD
jgi:hypothetical protein